MEISASSLMQEMQALKIEAGATPLAQPGRQVTSDFGLLLQQALGNVNELQGAANLGVRPMFEIDQPLLEVWLFDFDEVAGVITDKMIRRHPHVFEGLAVDNQEELLRNWERIKEVWLNPPREHVGSPEKMAMAV